MSIKNTRLLRRPRPRDDESLSGYLLRLSEANGYESLSWILQLTKLKDYANGSYTFVYGDKDLTFLSELTGVPESNLEKLLYKPIDVPTKRLYGIYEIFGQRVYSYIIRDKNPKICPSCLAEDPYCRKVWELLPVTACPIHNCLLMENCPNCDAKVIWNRKRVCHCHYCDYDWRQGFLCFVPENELRLVKHLYRLFNLGYGNPLSMPNVLLDLNVQDSLSAVFLILAQLQGLTDTKGKILASFFEDNYQLHTELNRAVNVFEDFPVNFFTFLDFSKEQYETKLKDSKETRKTKWIKGWKSSFENFGTALFTQLKSPQLQFLHDAFRQYLTLHKLPDEISSVCTPTNINEVRNNYLSAAQTRKILKVKISASELHKLADSGRLKAVIGKLENGTRYFFIERDSVENLKARLENSILLKDATKILGLTPIKIKELANEGIFETIRSPQVSGAGIWVFDRLQVEGVYNAFTNSMSPISGQKDESFLISFVDATTRLNRVGFSLKAFIQMVMDGNLSPRSIGLGTGLLKFHFERQKIEEIYARYFKEKTNSACTIREVARRLQIGVNTIRLLIKSKLLHAEVAVGFESLGLLVTQESIDKFNRDYIFARDINSKLSTQPSYITALLAERNIHPVSTPDGKKLSLFKRSDIVGIKLSKKSFKEPKEKAGSYYLTTVEAAEYLKLNIEEFLKLVNSGIVKPYRNSKKAREQFGESIVFSRHTIEKYQDKPLESSDLLSTKVAASIIGIPAHNFLARYVHTGKIKPALLTEGKNNFRYFRIADVNTLADEEKQLIRASEVSKILGVGISCVHKFTVAGDLTPIRGPHVDGKGVNFYRRSDVEALQEKREAFKAKQLQNGKSSRFGRVSGNRYSKRNS